MKNKEESRQSIFLFVGVNIYCFEIYIFSLQPIQSFHNIQMQNEELSSTMASNKYQFLHKTKNPPVVSHLFLHHKNSTYIVLLTSNNQVHLLHALGEQTKLVVNFPMEVEGARIICYDEFSNVYIEKGGIVKAWNFDELARGLQPQKITLSEEVDKQLGSGNISNISHLYVDWEQTEPTEPKIRVVYAIVSQIKIKKYKGRRLVAERILPQNLKIQRMLFKVQKSLDNYPLCVIQFNSEIYPVIFTHQQFKEIAEQSYLEQFLQKRKEYYMEDEVIAEHIEAIDFNSFAKTLVAATKEGNIIIFKTQEVKGDYFLNLHLKIKIRPDLNFMSLSLNNDFSLIYCNKQKVGLIQCEKRVPIRQNMRQRQECLIKAVDWTTTGEMVMLANGKKDSRIYMTYFDRMQKTGDTSKISKDKPVKNEKLIKN